MDNEYELAYNCLDAYVQIEGAAWDGDLAAVYASLASTAGFLVNDMGYDEDIVVQAIEDVCADNGVDPDQVEAAGAQY